MEKWTERGGVPDRLPKRDRNGEKVWYSHLKGDMPEGLTLERNGTFSGQAASRPGSYPIVVQVSDAAGAPCGHLTVIIDIVSGELPSTTMDPAGSGDGGVPVVPVGLLIISLAGLGVLVVRRRSGTE